MDSQLQLHGVIYLDLQKVVDSVPHNRLLCKPESYGISREISKLGQRFLMGRD